jgi:oxygen-independent coproporphyrinogen-3 oxidase
VSLGGVRHLYAHLPFCASRCGYCAFVVAVDRGDARDAYLHALLAELEARQHLLGPLRTVYLGGGTPTLMGADRLERLLARIVPHLAPGAEVSVEANPETLDVDLAVRLRDAGVTRLSIGAQSFRPHVLAALDRAASPGTVRRAVAAARDAGLESVSIDLLFAVPGQSLDDVAADLADVRALRPDHVSWYELELKAGSALARAHRAPAVDDDLAADMYDLVVDGLETAGYRWYELANFARPGHECRHSLAYWGSRDYLGLGVGAVSTLGAERRRTVSGLDAYLSAAARGEAPAQEVEALDADTRRRERWMLGTRLDAPLDPALAGPPDHPEALVRLARLGLVADEGAGVRLTRRGRFLQSAVVRELVELGA